jgi:rSAM/selenodomain-associated transferase 2
VDLVPYSFIIPTLNEAERIAALLTRLREQFPGGELVVVDGGSADATISQAEPRCDQLLLAAPGRARQMNAGMAAASGKYLFFLHADSQLSINAQSLESYLQSSPRWGFCRVRLSGDEWIYRLISACINWRSRITRVATGDQMLFFQRDFLRDQGGFDDIPLMEDVAVSKRLRRLATPLIISEPVVTSSRRWREAGVLKTIITMWLLRLAFFLGVSPRRLWQHYYGGN